MRRELAHDELWKYMVFSRINRSFVHRSATVSRSLIINAIALIQEKRTKNALARAHTLRSHTRLTVRGKTVQCVLDIKWKINRRPQNGIQFEGGKWRKENKREEVYGNMISKFSIFFSRVFARAQKRSQTSIGMHNKLFFRRVIEILIFFISIETKIMCRDLRSFVGQRCH